LLWSSDERALVVGAARFGFAFEARAGGGVRVRVRGPGPTHTLDYAVLHVLDFTSARKRMSVLVRAPSGTHLPLFTFNVPFAILQNQFHDSFDTFEYKITSHYFLNKNCESGLFKSLDILRSPIRRDGSSGLKIMFGATHRLAVSNQSIDQNLNSNDRCSIYFIICDFVWRVCQIVKILCKRFETK
jgi:magnesium-transporting ATPase (P-type)